MEISKTRIGLTVIKLDKFNDERGYFFEAWNKDKYRSLTTPSHYSGFVHFIQDNISESKRGVIRGLHFQAKPYKQGKLIQVIKGKVFDVAVDIDRFSPTFGQWEAIELDPNIQVYIPPGFAHGFQILSKKATVLYKCTNYYNKEAERTIIYNDRDLNIKWPIKKPILSEKDKNGIKLKDL